MTKNEARIGGVSRLGPKGSKKKQYVRDYKAKEGIQLNSHPGRVVRKPFNVKPGLNVY